MSQKNRTPPPALSGMHNLSAPNGALLTFELSVSIWMTAIVQTTAKLCPGPKRKRSQLDKA